MEITDSTADTFYLGEYGYFDSLCFDFLKDLQKEYPHIKIVCIFPYGRENNYRLSYAKYCFDNVICPIINVPKRSAILKRNKWMVDHSDITVTFYIKSKSIPEQIFYYAKSKNKSCINIASKRNKNN